VVLVVVYVYRQAGRWLGDDRSPTHLSSPLCCFIIYACWLPLFCRRWTTLLVALRGLEVVGLARHWPVYAHDMYCYAPTIIVVSCIVCARGRRGGGVSKLNNVMCYLVSAAREMSQLPDRASAAGGARPGSETARFHGWSNG
jgi:hypothetical protein